MESTWRKAWMDTEKFRHSPVFFWGIEISGAAILGFVGGYIGFKMLPVPYTQTQNYLYPAIGAVIGIIVGFLAVFILVYLWNLFRAPYKQRNDARNRVGVLEKERIPHIEVQAFTCKPASYERTNHTAWGELRITNRSSTSLQGVGVQIVGVTFVYEEQDEKGHGLGSYRLHEGYPTWSPANVYWSERNTGQAKQVTIPIPAGDTKSSLIAFCGNLNPSIANFNTPTYPYLLESLVSIEVSSPDMQTWRGKYYIEYHPPVRNVFEFIEWDSWKVNHKVIEKPIPDK